MDSYSSDGFFLFRDAFSRSSIMLIQDELLMVGNLIDKVGSNFSNIDELWNFYKNNNRSKGSMIYNAFKHLHTIKKLAISDEMIAHLQSVCQIKIPVLIDINCRIDSKGEERFLFDWHKDYWFSVCSTDAVVVWVPINYLDISIGGLALISNKYTEGKIFRTKVGGGYNSYADAVVLDESIPIEKEIMITEMNIGDALFFKFNTMHKSLPIKSPLKSRFTIQFRFADFCDLQFVDQLFRPGIVNSNQVDYITKG
jgi:hypothetical protein